MIALDVMGGDYAPNVIVCAALSAAQQAIPITLFGPQEVIARLLSEYDLDWERYPLKIHHTSQLIAMDDDPVASVRKKGDSSLVQAVLSVKDGRCQAVVSAGSSGALMVASTLLLGRQEGVDRPAIAGFLPTKKGKVLGLDLGANTELRAHHLVQFAHLGADYVTRMTGIKNPRIALLANGHEEGKGSALVKEAHSLLKQSGLNFVGNAEPYHVLEHDMDIIVCDGFTGNILLKTCEAVTDAMSSWLKDGVESYSSGASLEQVRLMQQAEKQIQKTIDDRLDYKQVGGALLLGVQGTVVVCHGASDAKMIERALIFAWNTMENSKNFQKEILKTVQL